MRERAIRLRDEYLARAALRAWVAAVLGREPAERGMAFVVDRFEAEAIAGGPPSDEELAPYRAAADAVTLEVFVSALARELASIRQAVGASGWAPARADHSRGRRPDRSGCGAGE